MKAFFDPTHAKSNPSYFWGLVGLFMSCLLMFADVPLILSQLYSESMDFVEDVVDKWWNFCWPITWSSLTNSRNAPYGILISSILWWTLLGKSLELLLHSMCILRLPKPIDCPRWGIISIRINILIDGKDLVGPLHSRIGYLYRVGTYP